MTRGRYGDRELRGAVTPREGYGRNRSLSEAQASVVWNGPVRVAMAFECFRNSGVKGLSQMRLTLSSERLTLPSESSSASDTIRQPET